MGCGGKLTRQQWFTLAVIGSVHFGSAICISLQAPFYPKEAESKNATASEYGFVFGIYELVQFIASPIFGNCMDLIGAKVILNVGIVTAATSCILFGLLDFVQDRVTFVALSFVIRITEALGASAAVTSAFAITAASFPENVATTFATLEIFYGLGYIVGPMLGGILFTFGGFVLPFLVMGTLLLLDAVAIFFLLPNIRSADVPQKGRLIKIIRVPAVILDSLCIAGCAICIGFYTATLEPHIREFNLSAVAVGFVFVVEGGTYALTAPIIGRLTDTVANPRHVLCVGCILVSLSIFLVGPAPFLPFDTSIPLVVVGLFCQGLAMACTLVSGFVDAIRSSVAAGFPDDIKTYGLVSGLWSASFSLGDFIGPSVAGLLEDAVGFRLGSMFVVAVQVVLLIAMLTFIFYDLKKKKVANRAVNLKLLDQGVANGTEKEKEPLAVKAT